MRGRSVLHAAGLLFLLIAFTPAPIQAARVRAMNLEVLTSSADRIFQGRCTQVRVERDPVLGQTVTHVTFLPGRSVKGAIHGPVTIKLLGDQSPSAPPGSETLGLPRFSQGEEVILFLHQESALGLTSPVGFGQGKFLLGRDRHGRHQAANSSNNTHLFEGLSATARQVMGVRNGQLRGGKEIPADLLLDLAGALARGPAGPR